MTFYYECIIFIININTKYIKCIGQIYSNLDYISIYSSNKTITPSILDWK